MKRSIRFHNVLFVLLLLALSAALLPGTAQASMVGFWKFDEGSGTTANDFSANNNDGTLIAGGGGSPSWVVGHTGNAGDSALKFQGWTDRVDVPITTALNLTNAFTIALWAKADYLGGYPYLLEFTNDSNGGARQWFFQGDNYGGDQMYMWSDANAAWKKGLGFKVGGGGDAYAWHHYALTYSGGVVTPYVDGVAKTAQTISGSPNFPSFTHLLIGGKNQNWCSWEGPIDDVVIFNNATTAAEVLLVKAGTYDGMPEPATLSLLVLGGLAMLRRRRAA